MNSNTPAINGQISQELQRTLRNIHTKKQDEILITRRQLTKDRFALEARLGEIRNGKNATNDLREDESFELAFELAMKMEGLTGEMVSYFAKRIDTVNRETDWINNNPDSENWHQLQQRLKESVQREREIADSTRTAMTFMDDNNAREKAFEADRIANITRQHIGRICDLFIEEVVVAVATQISVELKTIASTMFKELSNTVASAISDLLSNDKKSGHVSSTDHQSVILGTMFEMERERAVHGDGARSVRSTQCVRHMNKKLPAPRQQWLVNSDNTVRLHQELAAYHQFKADCHVQDNLVLEPLLQFEAQHWSGVSLRLVSNAPLLCSQSLGRLAVLTSCSLHLQKASLVVAGTSLGRLLVWKVLWSGQCATLVGISPQLSKQENVKIVEIRFGAMSSNQVLSLGETGHIRAWSLNPAANQRAKVKSSWFGLNLTQAFDRQGQFVPLQLESIFHVSPSDLNIPMSVPERLVKTTAEIAKVKAKKKRSNEYFDPSESAALDIVEATASKLVQPSMTPSTTCFHSSASLLGQSSSVLIGTNGGDFMKLNMDVFCSDMDVELPHIAPFVNVEYVNPLNAPRGVVLASAASVQQRGNKVFREIFHFHKTRVKLIGSVDRISNTIVSLDESSVLAVWHYNKTAFTALNWFAPAATHQLDLSVRKIVAVGSAQGVGQPSSQVATQLQCRSRTRLDDENVVEIYYPLHTFHNQVQLECKIFTPLATCSDKLVAKNKFGDSNESSAVIDHFIEPNATDADEHNDDDFNLMNDSIHDSNDDDIDEFDAHSEGDLHEALDHEIVTDDNAKQSSSSKPAGDPTISKDETESKIDAPMKQAIDPPEQPNDVERKVAESQPGEAATASQSSPLNPPSAAHSQPSLREVSRNWTTREVNEVVALSQVQEVKLSHDGTEIFMLITYANLKMLESGNVGQEDEQSTSASIVRFFVKSQIFHTCYPTIMMKIGEKILDFHIGPIMSETLTRVLFVLTMSGLRVFSAETAQELLPAVPGPQLSCPWAISGVSPSLSSFRGMSMTVCPEQRVLVLTSPDDARVVMFVFSHTRDGETHSAEQQQLSVDQRPHVCALLAQPSASLTDVAVTTVLLSGMVPDNSMALLHAQEVMMLCDGIVEDLWPAVFAQVDMNEDIRRSFADVAGVYGGVTHLGEVQPTDWAPVSVNLPLFCTDIELIS